MMATRQEFNLFLKSANLNDRLVRAQINQTVIGEVLDTRYQRKAWEVAGFAPLNTSSAEYLRPCPRVVFGQNGWHVIFDNQWFVD